MSRASGPACPQASGASRSARSVRSVRSGRRRSNRPERQQSPVGHLSFLDAKRAENQHQRGDGIAADTEPVSGGCEG